MLGRGKYDDECTAAREATGGEAVLLIVIKGDRGSGMSCQTLSPHALPVLLTLPTILRDVANQIEADLPIQQRGTS